MHSPPTSTNDRSDCIGRSTAPTLSKIISLQADPEQLPELTRRSPAAEAANQRVARKLRPR